MKRQTVFLALAFAALTGDVLAHEHATGIVKERMDMMESMAKNMKAIAAHMKSRTGLEAIRPAALSIVEHAPHIPMMFPMGSKQPPTEATDAVWRQPDDFAAKTQALLNAGKALAEADSKDFSTFQTRVRAVNDACSGCHETYRAKKK